MSLPQFLWSCQWARQRQGGKWEHRNGRWIPVKNWSSRSVEDPSSEREDWRPPERP